MNSFSIIIPEDLFIMDSLVIVDSIYSIIGNQVSTPLSLLPWQLLEWLMKCACVLYHISVKTVEFNFQMAVVSAKYAQSYDTAYTTALYQLIVHI